MKVMFIGGGRRNSLAKRFKDNGYEVLSYELFEDVPVSLEGKIIKGLRWDDPNVLSHIQKCYDENNCDLILPLMDKATPILSELNVNCPTSSSDVNNYFLDKKKFEELFSSDELKSIYPFEDVNYKIIEKPRFGCNSSGIKVYEVNSLNNKKTDFVYQRYIENGNEYSVDCYFSKDGKLVDAIVRERLIVQGGEVSKSVTINKSSDIYTNCINCINKISSHLKLNGPFCFQFIEKDGDIFIMEVNARFGGGVILSLESGFNIIDLITTEYILNKEICYKSEWKENYTMIRYFSEFFYG
jgi:carbamoyl-phosphate synthase large subunit